MTTQLEAPRLDLARVEEFACEVAGHPAAAYNGVLVYLGDRLGLWRALASVDSATSAELAERSGLAERYVREWLSAQAAAGYVTYDADDRERSRCRSSTPWCSPTRTARRPGGRDFEVITAVWAAADKLANAYASGDGRGLARARLAPLQRRRPLLPHLYRNSLLAEWLPAVDGLAERLESGIRVLDVGCGLGVGRRSCWPRRSRTRRSSASTTTRSRSAGPRRPPRRPGSSDRVQFRGRRRARRTPGPTTWCCFFDAVHDMGDPVGALAHARGALRPGGQVVRRRAVRRGPARGQPGQPDGAAVLRRQLVAVRPEQRLPGWCRARCAGRSGAAHRGVPDAGFTTARGGGPDGVQPAHRGRG